MAESWPQLRTLDLYDNNLTGPVPSQLADMRNLDFVQLQGNRFEGTVPAKVLAPGRFNRLKLSHNPELKGCLPNDLEDRVIDEIFVEVEESRATIGGTQIRTDCDEGPAGSDL